MLTLTFCVTGCKKKDNSDQVNVWDVNQPIKILAIGNSFSEDAFTYLWEIMESLGFKDVYLAHLYIGGCDIDTHYANLMTNSSKYDYRENYSGKWQSTPKYISSYALKSEMWDFITIQQVSGKSGLSGSYYNLNAYVDLIKEKAPTSKIVWHQTWAYQQDTNHADFPKYQSDQTVMYNEIIKAVKEEVESIDKIDFVIPSGTAIQNARTSSLGDTLTRDGYHLSVIGRYIAGLTYAYKLTGVSIENIEYAPYGVTEEVRKICIKSVQNACAKANEVTSFN